MILLCDQNQDFKFLAEEHVWQRNVWRKKLQVAVSRWQLAGTKWQVVVSRLQVAFCLTVCGLCLRLELGVPTSWYWGVNIVT